MIILQVHINSEAFSGGQYCIYSVLYLFTQYLIHQKWFMENVLDVINGDCKEGVSVCG